MQIQFKHLPTACLAGSLALVGALPLALAFSVSIASAEGAEQRLSLRNTFSAEAAHKVDPWLLLASSFPNRTPEGLKPLGRRLAILGTSANELRYPVLIRTSLADRELAALGAPVSSRVGDIVTSTVAERDLPRLAADHGVSYIEASYWLQSNLDLSTVEVRVPALRSSNPELTGTGVLYGLMDDGIDITHADFKNAQSQSRVLFVWDHYFNGTPPSGFNYGVEYSKAQIDAGQASQFVNEGGHGSHVAGISVGDGSSTDPPKYMGVAPNADIIAVRNGYCDLFCYGGGTPPWGDSSTKGSIDGLNYLLQKKTALGKPMVVNQSQGTMMGPHDGTTLFEATYNTLVTSNGLIICIAAGNDQESGWHGRKTSTGSPVSFTLNQDTQQGASAILQFEAWVKAGDHFNWTLRSPGGSTININSNYTSSEYPGQSTAHSDSVFFWATTSHPANQQGYVNVYMQNRRLGVEGGNWVLTANPENNRPAGGQVDVYAERNQYNFTVTDGLNLDAIVGMPGTSTGGICVASYTTKNSWAASDGGTYESQATIGAISGFSSFGPRRDNAQKPDLSAPGEWIMSTFAAGHQQVPQQIDPDLKHMIISGTSMATPHVAGAVALMLQKDPTLTPTEVKQILQTTARHDGFTPAGWSKQFGFGKLDVKAAVDAVGGGGNNCATRSGDADQNNSVNVLDVVATVNDILTTIPLGAGRVCADIDGNNLINVLDVVGIVTIILQGEPRPLADAAPSEPVAWNETFGEDEYRFTFDGNAVLGIQSTFIPPIGYELAGEPRLENAASGVELAHRAELGQHQLVVWNARGALGTEGRVSLVVPITRSWDGGEDGSNFHVTTLLLAGREGRELTLAESPSDEPALGDGVHSWIAETTPNPLRDITQISYNIERSGSASFVIYDASGRRVRELWNGWQLAGGHVLAWDGRNDQGHEVADGTYFARLVTATGASNQKLVVMKD